jgi:hypothetical protein
LNTDCIVFGSPGIPIPAIESWPSPPICANDAAYSGGLFVRSHKPEPRQVTPRNFGPNIKVQNAAAKAHIDAAIGSNIHGIFTGLVETRVGVVIGAAILNRFSGHDVHLTVAAKPFTSDFIRAIATVCFVDFEVSRVTAITRHGNRPAILALRRAGFVLEATMPAFFGEDDGLQFRLLSSQQRLTR